MGDVAIEVTQADRDAWQSMLGNYGPEIDRMVPLGAFDDDTRMVGLAAHRIASETALRSRVAVLEGALREVAGIKSLLPPGEVDAPYLEGWCDGQTYLSLNICPIIDAALTQDQQP